MGHVGVASTQHYLQLTEDLMGDITRRGRTLASATSSRSEPMSMHDLAPFVTTFFVRHLPNERNVSPHTTTAYRDTFKMLLRFAANKSRRSAESLHVEDITPERVLQFLTTLETERRNSVRTRNARLAAIHSFFRYVLDAEPELSAPCQRVLAIKSKKGPHAAVGYLSDTDLAHLLTKIDRASVTGERDYLLVALLYDTGARIQELLDLKPSDFRFAAPPFVRLRGKGRRERTCPLLNQTARLVSRFLSATGRSGRGRDTTTPKPQRSEPDASRRTVPAD
jgi:site-specific recombinase XerD